MKRIEQQGSTQEKSTQERPTQPHELIPQERMAQQKSAQTPADSIQSSKSESPDRSHDLAEAVRQRAYQIYEQRGMANGSEVDDWLQAESELTDTERIDKAA